MDLRKKNGGESFINTRKVDTFLKIKRLSTRRMEKVNTFFAAASWYDDDDSESFHVPFREPLRGTRVRGEDSWLDDCLDNLSAQYINSQSKYE